MSVLIIAEVGVNHNGSEDIAMKLIDVAVESGVDVVKFQTFKAENLVRRGVEKVSAQRGGTGGGGQYSMLKELELSDSSFRRIYEHCCSAGLEFMSTGFDEESVEFLVELGVKRLKIPSGEVTNIPLVSTIATKNIPVIVSTGMSNLSEVSDVVNEVQRVRDNYGFKDPLSKVLTLLHCTSNYPASLEDVNLRAMHTLKKEFNLPVGYSDHTEGSLVSIAAAAMGAVVIEKHFTLDKSMPGPDHRASLDPGELEQMVRNIRDVERCLGDGEKKPSMSEMEVRSLVRRSIVLARSVKKGTKLSETHLALLRPADGVAPKYMREFIGRAVNKDMKAGSLLQWDDVD